MTLENKQLIAATARTLIRLLEDCDDSAFVELVLECVRDADSFAIEAENL